MLSKFSARTSCHGISQIHASKSNKVKIFWVLIVLIFAAALIGQIMSITISYSKHSMVTSTIVSEPLDCMKMPKVLICQDLKLSVRFLKEHNISDALAGYIEQLFSSPSRIEADDELEKQYKQLLTWMPNGDVRQVFLQAGPNCSFLLAHCSMGKRPFNCCDAAEEKIDLKKGKCFLFNNLTDQKFPGSGLFVEARLSPDKYFYIPSHLRPTIGLTLRIFPSYDPFDPGEVKIPPGYKAMFEVEKEQTEIENGPFVDSCDEKAPANEATVSCRRKCFFEMATLRFNCTRPVDVSVLSENAPICSPKVLIDWYHYWTTTEVMRPYFDPPYFLYLTSRNSISLDRF